MALALILAQPRSARAENSLSYDHSEYQESGGRMNVITETAIAEQDIGTDAHIKVGGVIDTIAGATPTGQPAPAGSDQVVLTEIKDRRHAWNTDLSDQISIVNVDVGFARSIEHDYMSNGWSVNTLTDFNQKNTSLLIGAAGTDDNVEEFFKPGWRRKVSNDAIVGVNQLIDPQTSVSLDFTWSRDTGFLSDQYKLVQEDVQILPGISLPETFAENRPNERSKGIFFASVNRAFPSVNGTLEASYRYYHDTYSISAHTVEFLWFQHLESWLILRPNLRFYTQNAAAFYYYQLDGTGINPTRIPNPAGPFYTSDARMSAFDAYDFGIKMIWNPASWLQFDLSVDGYRQHGTDGVTPQSAYYAARTVTFGGKITW